MLVLILSYFNNIHKEELSFQFGSLSMVVSRTVTDDLTIERSGSPRGENSLNDNE